MNVKIIVRQVIETARREGLWSMVRKSFANVTRRAEIDNFDKVHGTNTAGIEPLWKLKVKSPNLEFGIRYQVSDEEDVLAAINSLQEETAEFTFIDLGCGKGRTLLIAAELGFKEVIGVEFAPELVEIARSNLAKLGVRGIVIHADAAEYEFPAGDLIIYLYNPFTTEIMEAVIARLKKVRSRTLYIIYNVPKCPEVLAASGFLEHKGPVAGKGHIEIWKSDTRNVPVLNGETG